MEKNYSECLGITDRIVDGVRPFSWTNVHKEGQAPFLRKDSKILFD